MTRFFDHIFSRYPVKTRRALELMPGFFSWILILSPIWGSFLFPNEIAYFILFFDVYWFYKSFSLVITAYIASKKIERAEKVNWLSIAKKTKNFNKTNHIVIIPNYKESVRKLRLSIESLAKQTFPRKRLYIVLAMEERESDGKEKANELIREFKHTFGGIFATYHPDVEGEVKGKSSNQAFAGIEAYKKLVGKKIINPDHATISTVDADTIFDRQYFSYLAYKFLTDPMPYNKFWQSANVSYNNFWDVPAPIRVIAFFGSLYRAGLLVQKDRLIANSTYSLSLRLLHTIGFWDTDVIPEDYRIFFKAFYKLQGQVWVEPIFLKTSMDAPMSSGYMRSLANKYHQERRWSWGVSDDALFIKWWFTVPNVPFIRKTLILTHVIIDHFLWPVNWFILTVAANIMPLVNPVFSRTALGYNLPKLAGLILTFCLIAIFAMILIDLRLRPSETKSRSRQLLFPLEFMLLPIVGFFLSTLPAIISHTQLMLGKRLEYKVTEKL